MNNAKGAVDIPLSTFGGLSTELSPRDIPEGGSPDNQDVIFVPGSVITRPALAKMHTTTPDATPKVYEKTLVKPDGTKLNLYLHDSGKLYSENAAVPGVFTLIATVAPGSRCKSVTAYGKEWMVFNDGQHGTDIPRQFDGVNFDRVSQGGPCGNPVFSETITPSVALAPGVAVGGVAITSITSTDPTTTTTAIWVED